MSEIARLFVSVGAKTGEFERGMGTVEGRMRRVSQSMGRIGATMTRSITLPLIGIGAGAVKLAADFENSMGQIGTLLGAEGADRVDELSQNVKDMARDTGKNLDDLAGGLYQVISAFGDSEEASEQLEIAVRAAVAGAAETTDAVNLLSAVTKGYGDTSADAMRHVSDLAFQTVKLGQTTFPELAGSIGRVTPLAASLGVEVEELFAGFATLTGVTGNTAEVSTQYAAILRAMMKPTEDMASAIHELGFESAQAMIEQEGMVGALRALTMTTDGSQEAIGKLFGRAEALTAVFALTGAQADVFDEKLAAMGETAGATDEAFEVMSGTIGFELNRLKQEFAVLGVELGKELIPLVRQHLLPLFRDLGERLGDLIKWYGGLNEGQKKVFHTLALAVVAGGPLLRFLDVLFRISAAIFGSKGVIAAILGFKAVVGGITLAGGPIAIAIVALAALAEAFRRVWQARRGPAEQAEIGKLESERTGIVEKLAAFRGVTDPWAQMEVEEALGVTERGLQQRLAEIDERIRYLDQLLGVNLQTPTGITDPGAGWTGDSNLFGGVIPGPIGEPRLTLAHGGEKVLTLGQQKTIESREHTLRTIAGIGGELSALPAMHALSSGEHTATEFHERLVELGRHIVEPVSAIREKDADPNRVAGDGILTRNFGGIIPGPIGRPQLVLAHGGEEVLTPGQQVGRHTTWDINVNFTGADQFSPESLRQIADSLGDYIRQQDRGMVTRLRLGVT